MNSAVDVNQIIPYVAKEFRLGPVLSIEELTAGKVNKTYKVDVDLNGQSKTFIFQNVNTYVFKKPREVMENIRRVTEYIDRYHPEVNCLQYRTTNLGETYMDMITSFWRVFGYIDSVTYNSSKDPVVVRNAGKAFGDFITNLDGFDHSFLHYTIADFHNTTKRLQTLESDYKADILDRAKTCAGDVAYVLSMRDKALVLDRLQPVICDVICLDLPVTLRNACFERSGIVGSVAVG